METHSIWRFRFNDAPIKVWTVVKSHSNELLMFASNEPKGIFQPTNWEYLNKLENEGKITCISAGQICKHCINESVSNSLCSQHIKLMN